MEHRGSTSKKHILKAAYTLVDSSAAPTFLCAFFLISCTIKIKQPHIWASELKGFVKVFNWYTGGAVEEQQMGRVGPLEAES